MASDTDCAVWARVSTDKQEAGNQLLILPEWARARTLTVVKTYVTEDSAWTRGNGGSKGREFDAARKQLLDDARHGEFKVLLIFALNRLSRRGMEDTLACVRRLTEAGVLVLSYSEPWLEDLRDPAMREFFIGVSGWVAQMYSDNISRATKAGLARKAAADPSFRPGRPAGTKDKSPRRRSGYVATWEPGGARRVALDAHRAADAS